MPAGVRYPTPPAPGEPIRATLLRDIIDCLKRITPLAGKNTTVDYGSYGARVNGTPGDRRGAAAALPYWTFKCTEDPDTHERTGGWYNCRLQIGFNCHVIGGMEFIESHGSGSVPAQYNKITGCDRNADGGYYVKVYLEEEKAEIVPSGSVPSATTRGDGWVSDYANGHVYIYLGNVRDAKLEEPPLGQTMHFVPTIFKFT